MRNHGNRKMLIVMTISASRRSLRGLTSELNRQWCTTLGTGEAKLKCREAQSSGFLPCPKGEVLMPACVFAFDRER